ncbi:MAG: tRNA pseudouridine(55) synthase TruB [Crocinitomicaceae bacterium]
MIKEFAAGSTILVDKPFEWTSFDVVNKLRWHLRKKLGVKKLKVGHAGTLDPLATGLLVLCIGKHTKKINDFIQDDKEYTGTILLGKTTPSFDLETEYNAEFDTAHITAELMNEVAATFIGEQDQVPPIFSAKQVDGKRAYEHARKGRDIELKANRINISAFEINTESFPEINFRVVCSKGTYIRSLASDFGKKLNSGATLIELRRTRSGEFNIDEAKSVEEWIDFIENNPL